MITIDSNLLIYAYDQGNERHSAARQWLETVLSGVETILLAWSSIHAFLRITTNDRIVKPAFTMEQAIGHVMSWLNQPNVRVVEPGARYWDIFLRLAREATFKGNMVIDAHLAVLAIENNATVCTADNDFKRFPGVRVINPLA
ncbi:MAG: PIN domain nuclease [Acidobacteria bacterium]|nr:MAG: PIN domain nuclease [Acidobacteriota bacterium]